MKYENITIGEFAKILFFHENEEALKKYGIQKGCLEQQDLLNWNQPLLRRTLARILHQFLVLELREKDENSLEPAFELEDLFDCHTCVNHVAQIYIKGIMEAKELINDEGNRRIIFGMKEPVSLEEANNSIEKCFKKAERIGRNGKTEIKNRENDNSANFQLRNAKEFVEWKIKNGLYELIDVRTQEAFLKGHFEGARSMPLAKLLTDVYLKEFSKETVILFYCEKGYQSEIAANYMLEKGFRKVYYTAMSCMV